MGKKGLLKKVKKLELKAIEKNKINRECIPALEEVLHDVYAICRPKPIDYYNRKDLVRIFNEIATELYGNSDDIPVVEEFGSFLMDIFSSKSDLDLSVNFSNKEVDFPREKKIKSLRKFGKKLYALQRKGHVSSVQQILTAKVPILKVVDRGSGIECDISVENRDGIVKSQIVHVISSIDERFRMLSFLMKVWAKAQDINSSKDRTLNSLSIISLVALHLQTRDPPILPPIAAILKDGTDPAIVGRIAKDFSDYGKSNNESLGELFVTLLMKLAAVETLWPKGLCASVYEGCWIFKEWDLPSKEMLGSKFACISVEDFTDRAQNVARAVGEKEVKKIYKSIHLSILYAEYFMNGKIQGTKLREVLFGRESIPAQEDKKMAESLDPQMAKRMRTREQVDAIPIKTVYWGGPLTDGWGATPVDGLGGKHVSIHVDQIQPKTMQYSVGWGEIQKPTYSDPTGAKGTQFAEGWEEIQKPTYSDPTSAKGTQFAAGWGGKNQTNSNSVSYASRQRNSFPAQNPTCVRMSGDGHLPRFLPPQNPWGSDG